MTCNDNPGEPKFLVKISGFPAKVRQLASFRVCSLNFCVLTLLKFRNIGLLARETRSSLAAVSGSKIVVLIF